MKKGVIFLFLLFSFTIPTAALALGLECAVSVWTPSPQGDVSYNPLDPEDIIDLKDDLRYEEEWHPSARAKFDLPLFPNIYLMATPLEYESTGGKTQAFSFGDVTFTALADFESKLTLNIYDIGLYYGIPFLNISTAGILDMEIGINARILDFKAEIEQGSLSESRSYTTAYPLVYAGVQINPVEMLTLEAEVRGISYTDVLLISAIGRLKFRPLGPVFVACGYRHELIDIDVKSVAVDTQFAGPFAEVGIEF